MATLARDCRIFFLQSMDIFSARQHRGRSHGHLPFMAYSYPGRRGLENRRLVIPSYNLLSVVL